MTLPARRATRELWVIEGPRLGVPVQELSAGGCIRMKAYRYRDEAERSLTPGANERITRYVPEPSAANPEMLT